jgi:hypothetical protein
MASFWGTSIKTFPLPPLEVVDSTNENTHPKTFVSSAQHLFMRFEWFVINLSMGERFFFVSDLSSWALELYEAIFVVFATLEGEAY